MPIDTKFRSPLMFRIGMSDYVYRIESIKSMMIIAEKQCEKAGVEFIEKIGYGNPGYEITKFANSAKNKIDMVIIGSRGRSSAKEIFFGSTSQFVLHKARPPVLIIK